MSRSTNPNNKNQQKIAVLLVDFQNEFVNEGGKLHGEVWPIMKETGLMEKVPQVVRIAREVGGITIIHSGVVKGEGETFKDEKGSRGYDSIKNMESLFREGFWNSDFAEEMKPMPTDTVLNHRKNYDAFQGTDLEQILKKAGVDTIIISGFLTDFCITESVRSANKKGFHVYTLTDGCAAKSGAAHVAALNLLSKYSTLITCQDSLDLLDPERTFHNCATLEKNNKETDNCSFRTALNSSTKLSEYHDKVRNNEIEQRRMSSHTDSVHPVFFINQQQRYREKTLYIKNMKARDDIWTPPSLSILSHFSPTLKKDFGNLSNRCNLLNLIDKVCTLVEEKNPEPIVDKHGKIIYYDRNQMVDTILDTIQILRVATVGSRIDQELYLVAIMDEIMSIGAAVNGKTSWFYQSEQDCKYVDFLVMFYGIRFRCVDDKTAETRNTEGEKKVVLGKENKEQLANEVKHSSADKSGGNGSKTMKKKKKKGLFGKKLFGKKNKKSTGS